MKNRTTQSRPAGAVLIFTLLVLVVGAVVLGGFAQLMATQSLVGSREWDEAAQRITLGNSRALARQYVLSRMFRRAVPTNSFGFTNASPPAGFALSNSIADFWQPSSPVGSVAGLNINPFNPLERGGFYPASITGTLYGSTNADGSVESVPWSFQVRMRNPIAAGYIYVRQLPWYDTTPSGVLVGTGKKYIDMRSPTRVFFGYDDVPRMPVTSVTNTKALGDTNGFQGYFDITTNSIQLYTNTAAVRVGTDTADFVVNLGEGSSAGLSLPAACVVPTTVAISNASYRVTKVVLSGSTTNESSGPVRVLVPATNTNVTELELRNANTRRVYFQRERGMLPIPALTVSRDAQNVVFRLGLSFRLGRDDASLSEVPISFTAAVRIKGGLRSDADVAAALNEVVPEDNPQGLDAIGDFMMWLEDYRLP
jgi:hypothetical protein